MLKITVIGTIMYDTIFPYKGRRKNSFGGILYNVLSLTHIFKNQAIIYPICFVSRDHFEQIKKKYFSKFSYINLEGIKISSKGTDKANLYYINPYERKEKIQFNTPEITFENIASFLKSKIILINFVKGNEISLSTLQQIRKNTNAIIFLDIHQLVRPLNKNGYRYLYHLPNWKTWLKEIDILQGNEEEIGAIVDKKNLNKKELIKVAKNILALGVKYVLITRGINGAILVHEKKGNFYQFQIKSIIPKKLRNPTGCGDVFATGFIKGILKYKNPLKAILLAVTMASINCEFYGLDGLNKISKAEEKMKEEFSASLKKIKLGWVGNKI